MLAYWQWADGNIYLKGRTPQESTERRELFARRLHLAGAMAGADVPLMAGAGLGAGAPRGRLIGPDDRWRMLAEIEALVRARSASGVVSAAAGCVTRAA